MKPQSLDTSLEFEKVQFEMLSRIGPTERLRLARAHTHSATNQARRGIAKQHPEWREQEVALHWAELMYGKELISKVRADLKGRMATQQWETTMLIEPLSGALTPVVAILEELDVIYYIGGSVASMTHGEYRQTADVDIVADLRPEHVVPFASALSGDFYVDDLMIRDSIAHGIRFNVMHLATMFKVDVFPLKNRVYDHGVAARRQRQTVETQPPDEAFLATAEDTLLAKFEWYRMGDEVSDRQWRDITGLLKTQRNRLDVAYLHHWARELRVDDLLERALQDASYPNAEDGTRNAEFE